jgi:predicted nucleic acid-binding protein
VNFFDTSILVAALQRSHSRHEQCLTALAATAEGTGCCAAQTLAELYSVLTRSPRPQRVLPEDALEMVELVRQRMRVVDLDTDEQMDVIRGLARRGLSGGIVHDALILRCARKAGATAVYTLNAKHFRLVDEKMAGIVREP